MFFRAGKYLGLGRLGRSTLTGLGIALLGSPALVLAKGEVTQLDLGKVLATPSRYEAASGIHRWGQGLDLKLASFLFGGERYTRKAVASRVGVRRVDNSVASGETCSLFAEVDRRPLSYQADFPGEAAGLCDFGTLFRSDIINRGAVDVFSNRDDGVLVTAGNIERLDFIFPDGILMPPGEGLADKAGFLITEKGGNSWLKVAAITAIDGSGTPTAYGKLLTLAPHDSGDEGTLRYGLTDISLYSDFLANGHTPPNDVVASIDTRFSEAIGAVFVSLQSLGLSQGDSVFGFSLFGADVSEQNNLLQPAMFPLDTERSNTPNPQGAWGGDADLYGGIAGYFTAASLRTITGRLFRDADGSGAQSPGEDGVSRVRITLYQDDGDGRFERSSDRVVAASQSATQGDFRFTGLPDGQYWVGLDTQDSSFPTGYSLAGTANPRLVVLNGADRNTLDFALFPVSGVDAALLARPDSFRLMAGQALRLDVQRNDRIPVGITPDIKVASVPEKGSVEIVGNALLYRPVNGQTGRDSFSYTLQAGVGDTSTTAVTITIVPVASLDSDGDGQLDSADPDDDNDGIPDIIEGAEDFDGDGVANQLDLDSDGDGILDIFESSLSVDAVRKLDADHDGRIGSGLRYPVILEDYVIVDSDGDGRPDFLDLDSDNDGIDDVIEAGFPDRDGNGRVDGGKPILQAPQDTDGNGVPDFRQLDSDADGRYDIAEAGIPDANNDGRVDHFVDDNFDGRSDLKKAVLGDEGTRALDRNGNGVPDFQEVDASKLHTGVSGWGGGSSSLLYLLALLTLATRVLRKSSQASIGHGEELHDQSNAGEAVCNPTDFSRAVREGYWP